MNIEMNVLSELLVDTFKDILEIERKSLQTGNFSDVSVTEIHTIEAIGVDNIKSMSQVASKLHITVGTLTIAINHLVKKSYVERMKTQRDRRVVQVKLTKKGELAYTNHEKFHLDMVNEIIEGLSHEEEGIFIKSLGKLNLFFKERYKLKDSGGV